LSGIPTRRRLGRVKLIRPALSVSRDDLKNLCRAAGWEWREDATNLDQSRLRAAIRYRVVPELERLRPGAAKRAGSSAALVRGAAGEVRKRARDLMNADLCWTRAALRKQSEVVLGELIKASARRLRGSRGDDRLSAAAVGRVARAIRDRSTEPREFDIAGVGVTVTARSVTMEKSRG
jgi:tRNA(Ile)-lysidine synthase